MTADWIAPVGLRPVEPDATHTMVPTAEMHAAGLSFAAIGLYSELLTYQGAPINPYVSAIDPFEEIQAAIGELLDSGYIVRVPQPRDADS